MPFGSTGATSRSTRPRSASPPARSTRLAPGSRPSSRWCSGGAAPGSGSRPAEPCSVRPRKAESRRCGCTGTGGHSPQFGHCMAALSAGADTLALGPFFQYIESQAVTVFGRLARIWMLRGKVGVSQFDRDSGRLVNPEVPMFALLAALTVLGGASPAPGLPPARAMPADGAPVRLWMNNQRLYREGERVRIQVDTDVEGFLLVLNYDTEGRVKVLFPLDPRDDSRVQAGRRYEVRDQDGSQAFIASGDGTGLIYSAVSPEPWRFEDVVAQDRWDYTKLDVDPRSQNPERDLTEVVQRIAGSRGFDYDVMGYRVYGERSYATGGYSRTIYVYDDALYCNNWYWRYNACRRWPYDGGWSFSTGIYFGSFYPYAYDPFFYGYGYRPFGYGYRPFGYGFGGYYPYVPYYPGRYSRPRATIVGRARGYTIQPRGSFGSWTPLAGNLTRGSGWDRNGTRG